MVRIPHVTVERSENSNQLYFRSNNSQDIDTLWKALTPTSTSTRFKECTLLITIPEQLDVQDRTIEQSNGTARTHQLTIPSAAEANLRLEEPLDIDIIGGIQALLSYLFQFHSSENTGDDTPE